MAIGGLGIVALEVVDKMRIGKYLKTTPYDELCWGGFLKFNYYTALLNEAKRIESLCNTLSKDQIREIVESKDEPKGRGPRA